MKWRAKEENIKKILEEYIDNLNIGLSNIIDIFAPQAICLGGGFVYFEEILYKTIFRKNTIMKENLFIKIEFQI